VEQRGRLFHRSLRGLNLKNDRGVIILFPAKKAPNEAKKRLNNNENGNLGGLNADSFSVRVRRGKLQFIQL
jgi:hypothetical protein